MEAATGLLEAIIVVFGGWVVYSIAMFFYRVPAQLKRIADAVENKLNDRIDKLEKELKELKDGKVNETLG